MLFLFIVGVVAVIGLWAIVIIGFVSEPWTDYTKEMRKSIEMDRREARAKAMNSRIMSAPSNNYYQRKDDDVGDDMFRSEQLRFEQEQARLEATGFEFGGYDTQLADNPGQFAQEMNNNGFDF